MLIKLILVSFALTLVLMRDEQELEGSLIERGPPLNKSYSQTRWMRKPFTKNGVCFVEERTECLMANSIICKNSLQLVKVSLREYGLRAQSYHLFQNGQKLTF
ncbi:hypothetical protein CCR75_000083 [Bremia lactucae]|uniref:Uncharacterized protein n=1 Tax=Bremia lactucae TaxID=4779 RepID=A0A976IDJ8_BRELC|nr:hypothetical protein CCR75_000083 [Bremia lactucae]